MRCATKWINTATRRCRHQGGREGSPCEEAHCRNRRDGRNAPCSQREDVGLDLGGTYRGLWGPPPRSPSSRVMRLGSTQGALAHPNSHH